MSGLPNILGKSPEEARGSWHSLPGPKPWWQPFWGSPFYCMYTGAHQPHLEIALLLSSLRTWPCAPAYRHQYWTSSKQATSWEGTQPHPSSIFKNTANNTFRWRCDKKRNLLHCWRECRLMEPLWKNTMRVLNKLEIEQSHDPAVLLLDIYLKKTKALIMRDICTPIFFTALFAITKIQKKYKCPWIDEWIKKMWYKCICMYIIWYQCITQPLKMKPCHLW